MYIDDTIASNYKHKRKESVEDEPLPAWGEEFDLGDMFTDEGKGKISVGDILVFNKDGQEIPIRVTKASPEEGYAGTLSEPLMTAEEAEKKMQEEGLVIANDVIKKAIKKTNKRKELL